MQIIFFFFFYQFLQMCSKCFSLDILRKGKAWFSMYSVGVTLYPISPGLLERSMKSSMQSLGLSRDPNKGFPRKQLLVCQSLIPCHSRPHLSDTERSTLVADNAAPGAAEGLPRISS